MRRDLMHWDTALQLARTLAEADVPFISREYAQRLEFIGDYPLALRHYEMAVTADPEQCDHDETCAAGIARMALRTSDLHRLVLSRVLFSVWWIFQCIAVILNAKS